MEPDEEHKDIDLLPPMASMHVQMCPACLIACRRGQALITASGE